MPLRYQSVQNNLDTVADLKQLRFEAHISQATAGRTIGVSRDTIRAWEENPQRMKVADYRKYVAYLDKMAAKYASDPAGEEFSVLPHATGVNEATLMTFPGFSEKFVRECVALGIDFPENFDPYELVPDRPVTASEYHRWEDTGVEPYPGFASTLEQWRADGAKVLAAYREAKMGVKIPRTVYKDPTDLPYEFDEDGNPVEYDNPSVDIDATSGEATISVPEE